jgi:hypothetical protein
LSATERSRTAPSVGCRFQSRCPIAQPRCGVETPTLREVRPDHLVACHFYWRITKRFLAESAQAAGRIDGVDRVTTAAL